MNILEAYIVEVHSVKEGEPFMLSNVAAEAVEVDWTLDCYGTEERFQERILKTHYEACVKRGYDMR